ncbi:GNAT family N-acetyltransferase [Nocardiopsis synnemataformans]|uniref:GNAT family N-acetyltransferase n=1 Tax=Nocardiopsis synnemataformans TaxID=61305 RepID=UPI003EBB5CA6
MSATTPTGTPPVSLRVMELSDVPVAVHLHRTNLPTGFFVELGDRFLSRYYRTFLTSPAAVALVAEVEGRAVGFLVGSTDEAVHHRHVIDLSRWDLARAGVTALLFRPELTARFMRTRARRYLKGIRRAPERATTSQEGPRGTVRAGVLSHIVVDSTLRRGGVGAVLVKGFASIARVHGVKRLSLYTSHDNHAAQRFYQRLGWQSHPWQTDIDGKSWTPFTLDL